MVTPNGSLKRPVAPVSPLSPPQNISPDSSLDAAFIITSITTTGDSGDSGDSREIRLRGRHHCHQSTPLGAPQTGDTTGASASRGGSRGLPSVARCLALPQGGPSCPSSPPAPWCEAPCPRDRAPRALYDLWRRHYENQGDPPGVAATLARATCQGLYRREPP